MAADPSPITSISAVSAFASGCFQPVEVVGCLDGLAAEGVDARLDAPHLREVALSLVEALGERRRERERLVELAGVEQRVEHAGGRPGRPSR